MSDEFADAAYGGPMTQQEADDLRMKAECWTELVSVVLNHWSGEITSERNTGDPGGLLGVVIGVFAEIDRLRGEVERLREALGATTYDEDGDCVVCMGKKPEHFLDCDVFAALHTEEPS